MQVRVNPWKIQCSLDINAQSELPSEGINSQWNTMGLTGLTSLHPNDLDCFPLAGV